VAILTGQLSGLFVLDVDPRHGGDETLVNLLSEEQTLDGGWHVKTGGGGTHVYFSCASDNESRSGSNVLGTGLEVRANGGYIVAPPSRHAVGACYRWLDSFTDDDIPTEIPAWIANVLPSDTSATRAPSSARDKIPEGGRNDHLVQLAGKLRGENRSEWEIELKLLEENQIGRDAHILARREQVYRDAKARHPQRWSGNTRNWKPVGDVHLNPQQDATKNQGKQGGVILTFRRQLPSNPPDATTNHILLVLSTYMDTDGRSCFPSIETVAASSKRHPDTVKRVLRKAAKKGWIGKFPRFVGGEQTSNGHVATIPGVITGTPGGDPPPPLPPS
jgi:hypothetical protein